MVEAGDDPRELQSGDHITFEHPELAGTEYRVSDTDVQDLGLGELFVATLISGCDRYTLSWMEGGTEVAIECLENDKGWDVPVTDVVIQ